MLEVVKMTIDNLPDTSFMEFYGQYVMDVQDMMLERELKYLNRMNNLNTMSITKLICDELERLKNDQ